MHSYYLIKTKFFEYTAENARLIQVGPLAQNGFLRENLCFDRRTVVVCRIPIIRNPF